MRSNRVAVVGVGPSGLTAIKELISVGVDVTGYELGDRVGGTWVYENSGGLTAGYKSLHLNTSKHYTEFSDFPMPDAWPDYPSSAKFGEYLQHYADTFGVTERVRFSTGVERVEKSGRQWLVSSDDGRVERFDAVLVCNGHYSVPAWPSPAYPGEFAGEHMHAHSYRVPEIFRDKRVMVVGFGNSAMDIAVDASYVTDDVLLSVREGSWIVPKYLFGRPAARRGGSSALLPWRFRQAIAQHAITIAIGLPEQYGLPKPSTGLLECMPATSDTILSRITHGEVRPKPGIERFDGGSVVFTDGSSEAVDVVVWATGYRVSMPFLGPDWLGDEPANMPLFMRTMHPVDPTLMFVGLLASTGAAPPLVEAQAKLAAAYLGGNYALPSGDHQQASIRRSYEKAVDRWGARSIPYMRVDFDEFIVDLEHEIAAGGRRVRRGAPRFHATDPAASLPAPRAGRAELVALPGPRTGDVYPAASPPPLSTRDADSPARDSYLTGLDQDK